MPNSISVSPRIQIRDIELFSEMQEVEELQKEVWGWNDRDIAPASLLRVVKEIGGTLIGVFDAERMVGFVFGLVGFEHGQRVIHSDMLAVKPAYRNFQLGYRLKLAQRQWALAQGVSRMTWTFDPLQYLNAHFNFRKLGVIADCYKINFYGEATSSFLHRTGTDRLWVSWLLNSRRVRQRLEGKPDTASLPAQFEGAARLVQESSDGSPCRNTPLETLLKKVALIEIPADIGVLQKEKPELAVAWREATRSAFTEALDRGFLVEDFYRQSRNGRQLGVYLLLDRLST